VQHDHGDANARHILLVNEISIDGHQRAEPRLEHRSEEHAIAAPRPAFIEDMRGIKIGEMPEEPSWHALIE
jgi:hypothetical protein